MSSVARAVGTASVRRVKRSLLPSRCFSTIILRLWSVDQELVGSIKCFHQGCSYTDPQSSRKSEVLDTRLSCALHWSQGIKKSVVF